MGACEEALVMKPGEATTACQANSAETRDLALEASPLYQPLAELAREGFTGKAPNILSNALRRMAPSLRAAGIELQFGRNDEQGRRMVSVLNAARVENIVSHRQ